MRNFILLASLLVLLFLGNGYCFAQLSGGDIVAKYNKDNVVTVEELNQYVKDWLYYKKFRDRKDIYNSALNDLLINQCKRIDFFEKGLDKNKDLIKSINRIINEELVSEYFETQYLGKYANEVFAKEAYKTMDKEVIYRAIELNKPSNASQKQLDSLVKIASEIKSKVEKGVDFNSLFKKYSQNETSSTNNGYMPPVDWKQSHANSLGNTIFNLNKNDVRILNTDNTIMIAEVTDINKITLEPFDSIKTEIITDLKKAYANKSIGEYEKEIKGLIDESKLKWDSSAVGQLVRWSSIPNFYGGEYRNIINTAIKNGENKIVLTYDKGVIDYNELLRLFDDILVMGNSKDAKASDIKKFLLEALRTDLIVKKAETLDIKKNIFNPLTTNPALKTQIAFLYNQSEIEAKIPPANEEVLYNFFKENENTLYFQLEKRNLFVLDFNTKIEAEKAAAKIKDGTPFEKVTGSYLVKTYIKERDGEIKSFMKDKKPTFSKVGFEMKESEVSGIISFEDENGNNKFAILKCYQIRPEKQLTYDDVRNSITEDFKNFHRNIIAKNVEEMLRTKYKPVIIEDVLTKLISSN